MRRRQREPPLQVSQEGVFVQWGGYPPQLDQLNLHAAALTISELNSNPDVMSSRPPFERPCDCLFRRA